MNPIRRILGALAGAVAGLLWTPIILFLIWLPRLGFPDELAYGFAISFVLGIGLLGLRRPRFGATTLAVASLSWLGLAILLWLQIVEVA